MSRWLKRENPLMQEWWLSRLPKGQVVPLAEDSGSEAGFCLPQNCSIPSCRENSGPCSSLRTLTGSAPVDQAVLPPMVGVENDTNVHVINLKRCDLIKRLATNIYISSNYQRGGGKVRPHVGNTCTFYIRPLIITDIYRSTFGYLRSMYFYTRGCATRLDQGSQLVPRDGRPGCSTPASNGHG